MKCAKWISNEEILGIVVKILDIEPDNKRIVNKDLERFFKFENISISKYKEIEEYLLKEISSKLKIGYIDLIHLLNVLNQIKIHNPTLNVSRKQLDFILLFDVIIPFFISKADYKFLEILKKYINSKSPFEKFLDDYLELKKKLIEEKGIDTTYKNLKNWINGKNISKSSVNEILELIDEDKKEEFLISLWVMRVINNLRNYFGEKISKFIFSHINLLIDFDFAMKDERDGYKAILEKLNLKNSWMLREYFYRYIERNDYVFVGFDDSRVDEFYVNEILIRIKELYNYKSMVILDENQFFSLIDDFFFVDYIRLNLEKPFSEVDKKIKEVSKYTKIDNDMIILDEISRLGKEEFISEFSKLYESLEDKSYPLAQFFMGIYLVKRGKLKEALEKFKLALNGVNCIGSNILKVIEFGLMVSAKLNNKKLTINFKNNKSDFIKFYFEGYRLGVLVYPKDFKPILNDYKLEFERRYGKLKTLKAGNKNVYFGLVDEIQKIKPDLKKPNKKIKLPYKNYKIHQLLHFAGEGSFEDVKRLVEAGADVNCADEVSNYTALIAALENPLDEERRKIAFYLIDKMDKDIIKKELIKKKKSALDYAKEWGESEIVEKIKERLSKI
ncbi:MAG: hypothetical protein ABGX26_02795 [Nautiliaceae bacterium]